MQVDILEAKTDFSKLIRLLEAKKEKTITVARTADRKPHRDCKGFSFVLR